MSLIRYRYPAGRPVHRGFGLTRRPTLFSSLFDDDFFERFFADMGARPDDTVRRPAVDVTEEDGTYKVVAELPGMSGDDVEVEVHGGVLRLSADREEEREEGEDDVHLRERRFGRFERAFRLPEHVDAEAIEASMKDGVLTVTVPKAASEQPRQIEVNV